MLLSITLGTITAVFVIFLLHYFLPSEDEVIYIGEPQPMATPPPGPGEGNITGEIILFEKNGTKEVCINLSESTSNIQFHAWLSDGLGIDLPMISTSEPSCMYWINLPAGAEGGTLKIDGNWAFLGNFLVRAESGCSEVVTINEGIIKASTSPKSSLLETRDSINGDSVKWGWACK